ncbi:histone-fold-containing protein, partial [Ochromonadaceae sp. CCMP2298]
KKPKYSFHREIHRVLKQVHPQTSISKKSMGILNDCMGDILERLASESRTLLTTSNKTQLSSREMQTSAKFLLPGELSKHAVSEGTKSVMKFYNKTPG